MATNPPARAPLTRKAREHLVDATAGATAAGGGEDRPEKPSPAKPGRRQGKRRASPTVALYVRLDVDLVRQLEERSDEEGITKTEAVEQAVQAWLES